MISIAWRELPGTERTPRGAASAPPPSAGAPRSERPSPPRSPSPARPSPHLLGRRREPGPARPAPRRSTHPEEEVEGVQQAAQALHRVLPGHGEPPRETAPFSHHILPPEAGPPAPCRRRGGEGPGESPCRGTNAQVEAAEPSRGAAPDRRHPGGSGRAPRALPQRPPVAHPGQRPFSSRPARRSWR